MSKPVRMLFKSIEEGDRKKLIAQSNISKTGGGARDIRLPNRPFEPATKKMFPTVVQMMRTRDKQRQPVDIRSATLVWLDEKDQEQQVEISYEPPTTARPSEGRIARVHLIPPLAVQNLPPTTDGRAVVLFIEHDDGRLRAHYTSHAMLANPPIPWNAQARDTILEALKVTPVGRSACGWADFTTGRSYVHE